MSGYRRLFIFIEGDDDERFFKEILYKQFKRKYDYVRPIKYAQRKKSDIEGILNTILNSKNFNADYIFVADLDNTPCITRRKEKLINFFDKKIQGNLIFIVVKEIEGWYLAGLDDKAIKKLGLKSAIKKLKSKKSNTELLTKEDFDSIIPERYKGRIPFMEDILNNFSINSAKLKNKSFEYFVDKLNLFP